LIAEGKRASRSRKSGGKAVAIAVRLVLDLCQCDTLFLCLDNASGIAIDVQQVIGEAIAGRKQELPDGDAASGIDVEVVAILELPTGVAEQSADIGYWEWGPRNYRERFW
jgi:hypothetical protein